MTIDLATLVERHGTAGVLSVGGGVIGLLFGFFAQRSRFCLRAAVIEFWRGKFAEKLSVWLLAFATALIAVQGLILAGWLDVSGVRQLANRSAVAARGPMRLARNHASIRPSSSASEPAMSLSLSMPTTARRLPLQGLWRSWLAR